MFAVWKTVSRFKLGAISKKEGLQMMTHNEGFENSRLDEAARRLSHGENLQSAALHSGYRFLTSASVQIANVPYDRDIERIVAQRFRTQICEKGLRDIGVYRHGPDVWLMVASPFVAPAPGDRHLAPGGRLPGCRPR